MANILFQAPAAGGLSRSDHLNDSILSVNGFNSPISATTGAFTPQNNSLLVVVVAVEAEETSGDDLSVIALDDTGADLTWTKRIEVQNSNGFIEAIVQIYTAPGTTGV